MTDALAWPDDAVEVGRVIDAWGIKGGFKVQAFSADPQALFSSRRWFLQPALPQANKPALVAKPAKAPLPLPPLLKITSAREQGDVIVATAQEIPDRTAAESLKGVRVFISRQSFPTASADEFYWVDLIGLSVLNREGELLGEVIDLLDTGPHSVLRVRKPDAAADAKPDDAERLIPFVAAFVDKVEMEHKRIIVDWGLDY